MAVSVPHDEIVEAAKRVFTEHGYAGASLERIAAAAGVSRVTLHRRGISRDGLLADLIATATDDYRRAMWPALTGTGSAAERLFVALEHLCAASEEQMGLLLALPAQAGDVFHDDGEEALTRTVFTEPLERLFRDGIADGSLSAADPEEAATVTFNLVGWTYIHLRSGHGWSPERACRGVLEPLRHGLLAGPLVDSGGR